jgi:hypothetical protein
MIKLNRVFHIKNIIVGIVVVLVSTYIITMVRSNPDSNAELYPSGHAEQDLTIEHSIQAKSQLNNCTYFVLISVWDNRTTMRPIPNALVEFKTPLMGTIANTTDQEGNTMISLSLEKKQQQGNCMTGLISQGYSIEARSKGFIGLGIGTIS